MMVLTLLYMCWVSRGEIGENLDMCFCFVFFMAWAGIAGFTTFVNPFQNLDPANGFLAAWLGFLSSLGNLVYNVKLADSMKNQFLNQGLPLCLIIVGSVIVIVAGVLDGNGFDGGNVIAVVAGTVSLVVALVRIFVGKKAVFLNVFLLGWWVILGIILTFGEFRDISNGYIATWVCLLGSARLSAAK